MTKGLRFRLGSKVALGFAVAATGAVLGVFLPIVAAHAAPTASEVVTSTIESRLPLEFDGPVALASVLLGIFGMIIGLLRRWLISRSVMGAVATGQLDR